MLYLTLVLIVTSAFAQDILRPADQTSVKPGSLSVVVKASASAQLTLDGAAVPLKQEGPGAMSALIKVTAGKHTLLLKDGGAEKKVDFMGGPGMAEFHVHPPAATCDTCHAVKEGAWAFKSLVLSDSCFMCHDQTKFPSIHTHVPDVLVDCQMCHQPHGSAASKHLKMKKEVACKQCHG